MSDENLPAVPEVNEKRPTTRAGRAAAVKPWKTSKRVKRQFREFLSTRELYDSIRNIIKDDRHPHFMKMLELMLEYGEVRKVDPIMEDDDTPDQLQPSALPPHVHRTEVVKKVFNEAGDLIKVFGSQTLKVKPEEVG